jgi:hypothetical protein
MDGIRNNLAVFPTIFQTENTLNGEISTKSVYISVNNNTNGNIFLFFLHYM